MSFYPNYRIKDHFKNQGTYEEVVKIALTILFGQQFDMVSFGIQLACSCIEKLAGLKNKCKPCLHNAAMILKIF